MKHLRALQKRGYDVCLVDSRLKVSPSLTSKLREQVQDVKSKLVAELRALHRGKCRECGARVKLRPYDDGSGWCWYECECSNVATTFVPALKTYFLIDSKLLGGIIAIGSNIPRRKGLVGYTWAECRTLLDENHPPKLLESIHQIKKQFRGASVERNDGFWWELAERRAA